MKCLDRAPLVRRALLLALTVLAVSGCAVGPDRRDPLEPFNRGVMKFNDEVDAAVIKPVATAYQDLVPSPARKAVGNVFSNLREVGSMAHSLLQFKCPQAAESLMRVSINTVLGVYGILDIATEAGLERHREDFGQTLGHWGVPPGPYLVLPLLGPSTVRDATGLVVDRRGDLVREADPENVRIGLEALRVVDTRATYLRAGRLLEEVSLDRYMFVRDAYLQRRQSEILDGESPQRPETKDD